MPEDEPDMTTTKRTEELTRHVGTDFCQDFLSDTENLQCYDSLEGWDINEQDW